MNSRTKTDEELRALVDEHNAGSQTALLKIMQLPPSDLARAMAMLKERENSDG